MFTQPQDFIGGESQCLSIFGRFWCKDKDPQNILARVFDDVLGRAVNRARQKGKSNESLKCPWKRGTGTAVATAKFFDCLNENGWNWGSIIGLQAFLG